jgi:hypothetical protein
MKTLKEMAVDHSYYCSDSNWYSNEPNMTYETMTEFLDDFEDSDIDMNLMFRWDIKNRSEDEEGKEAGRYYAEVFQIMQRKGIFKPIYIAHVNEAEIERFQKYALAHWAVLKSIWEPIV